MEKGGLGPYHQHPKQKHKRFSDHVWKDSFNSGFRNVLWIKFEFFDLAFFHASLYRPPRPPDQESASREATYRLRFSLSISLNATKNRGITR